METLNIELLAAMRAMTNSVRELTISVNNLKHHQLEQPVDYVKIPHLNRQSM